MRVMRYLLHVTGYWLGVTCHRLRVMGYVRFDNITSFTFMPLFLFLVLSAVRNISTHQELMRKEIIEINKKSNISK